MTTVPIEATMDALDSADELAVLPVQEQEHGTAALLIARSGRLWIACRIQGSEPTGPPGVVIDSTEWHEVGIGPLGTAGRVPGGLLGGPEASDHFVTVVAGDHIYEAKLHGSRGMEAVEEFASVALHAGARDFEP
jgi:hypothetical protein